jgi:hypothetical protein
MTVNATVPRLRGAPARIFVSVDESTGRSILSFAPADVGEPVAHADDGAGAAALATARAIAASYPGCTIVGPHFHASARGRPRPARRKR